MRHFLYTSADGRLLGTSSHPGGFGDELDLSDPNCGHPLVIGILKAANARAEFDRFTEFVCPCPSSVDRCSCAHDKVIEAYAERSVLTMKPVLSVLIDGSPAPTGQIIGTPGSVVELKLQASVPDGSCIEVRPAGVASVMTHSVVLTFSGGESSPINLTIPATSMSGRAVGIGTKYVRQFSVELKGSA